MEEKYIPLAIVFITYAIFVAIFVVAIYRNKDNTIRGLFGGGIAIFTILLYLVASFILR